MKNYTILFLTITFTLCLKAQYSNTLKFQLVGNNYTDETIIRLLPNATETFDGSFDAWKLFSPNPNVPAIYTQAAIGQELSINSLPEYVYDKSITIYTDIKTAGQYTLNIVSLYPMTSNYKISLTDITNNIHYPITNSHSLTFNLGIQQNTPTFKINISTLPTSNTTSETCFNTKDGKVTLHNDGNTDWEYSIADLTNNIIINNTATNPSKELTNLTPGDYTATIKSQGIIDTLSFTISAAQNLVANFELNQDTLYLIDGANLNITNNSINAQNYNWNLGDGSTSTANTPTHSYNTVGNYNVELTVTRNSCQSKTTKNITVLNTPDIITSIKNKIKNKYNISNSGNGNYTFNNSNTKIKIIQIINLNGKVILSKKVNNNIATININNQPKGIYLASLITENGHQKIEKIIR